MSGSASGSSLVPLHCHQNQTMKIVGQHRRQWFRKNLLIGFPLASRCCISLSDAMVDFSNARAAFVGDGMLARPPDILQRRSGESRRKGKKRVHTWLRFINGHNWVGLGLQVDLEIFRSSRGSASIRGGRLGGLVRLEHDVSVWCA